MVDPAYKLERQKEADEKFYAYTQAAKEVARQMEAYEVHHPLPLSKVVYESWYQVEKSIRKFDRMFNKVEKFSKRKFS